MITVICANTRMLWLLPTTSNLAPFRIMHFILETLNNEQRPCKLLIVDEDIFMEKSTDITKLIVDKFNISLETTGRYTSWPNGKNEHHSRSSRNIVISGLFDSNQHKNKWCCAAEIYAEVYTCKIHSALHNASPHFAWYAKRPSIHKIIAFECDIYPIKQNLRNYTKYHKKDHSRVTLTSDQH